MIYATWFFAGFFALLYLAGWVTSYKKEPVDSKDLACALTVGFTFGALLVHSMHHSV